MASIRRKPDTKYWYACFTMPDGKQVQRSTKTTDQKLAMKLAEQFEEVARNRRTELQARRVISDIHEKVSGKPLHFASVRGFLSQWLAAKKGSVSSTTYRSYESAVNEFCLFMGERAESELIYISKEDITLFRDTLGKRLMSVTANTKLKILRVALQEAWREGIIEDNPAARVPSLKVTRNGESQRRAFTLEEIKAVLEVADGEWEGMILFGLYTGQRLGDISRLSWQHVDLATHVLSLTTEKTGRRQVLPLATPLKGWLEEWDRESSDPNYIFPKSRDSVIRTGGRVATLSNQFHALLSQAGLVPHRPHRKQADGRGRSSKRRGIGLSFHSLRHTATSMMKSAGISSAIVQEFVGHDSKAVSQAYTHIETEALRRAAQALPDIRSER